MVPIMMPRITPTIRPAFTYTPEPIMITPVLHVQSFATASVTINMPSIVRADIFTNAETVTALPMNTSFVGVYIVQTASIVVPPDTFRNTIVAAELPAPAGFAGTMAMLSSAKIIRPDTFDGADAKFIQ